MTPWMSLVSRTECGSTGRCRAPAKSLRRMFLVLAMVALQQAAEGKVFVQVWPVQPKGGDFDVIELLGGAASEPGIVGDRKAKFISAFHRDNDAAFAVAGRARFIGQGVHATFRLYVAGFLPQAPVLGTTP